MPLAKLLQSTIKTQIGSIKKEAQNQKQILTVTVDQGHKRKMKKKCNSILGLIFITNFCSITSKDHYVFTTDIDSI